MRAAVKEATLVATSSLAYVEAKAAFARRRRDGGLTAGEHRRIARTFDADWPRYLVLEVVNELIREAAKLAERRRLRAYDAVHLASALVLQRRLGRPVMMAARDSQLEAAALAEGLRLVELVGTKG